MPETLLARRHKTFDERLQEDRAGNTSAHAPAD